MGFFIYNQIFNRAKAENCTNIQVIKNDSLNIMR